MPICRCFCARAPVCARAWGSSDPLSRRDHRREQQQRRVERDGGLEPVERFDVDTIQVDVEEGLEPAFLRYAEARSGNATRSASIASRPVSPTTWTSLLRAVSVRHHRRDANSGHVATSVSECAHSRRAMWLAAPARASASRSPMTAVAVSRPWLQDREARVSRTARLRL